MRLIALKGLNRFRSARKEIHWTQHEAHWK